MVTRIMCELAKQTSKSSDRRMTMMMMAITIELIGQIITEHDTYMYM